MNPVVKSQLVQIDGQDVEIKYEKVGNTLWVYCAGQTYSFETQRRSGQKKSGGGSSSPGHVLAPMPGKIMKVFCSPGDQVSQGDDVIAMEAMKMEYVLKADINGQIDQVSGAEGEQVTLGQLLVTIKGNSQGDSQIDGGELVE